jgi:hypothetical protein
MDDLFNRIKHSINLAPHLSNKSSKYIYNPKFEEYMRKQEILTFIRSLEKDARKQVFLPFLTLIAPTDEFILFLSFTFFFILFYKFFSDKFIGNNLDSQIKEVTLKFEQLAALREKNIELAMEIKHMMSFLDTDAPLLVADLANTIKQVDLAFVNQYKQNKLRALLATYKPIKKPVKPKINPADFKLNYNHKVSKQNFYAKPPISTDLFTYQQCLLTLSSAPEFSIGLIRALPELNLPRDYDGTYEEEIEEADFEDETFIDINDLDYFVAAITEIKPKPVRKLRYI